MNLIIAFLLIFTSIQSYSKDSRKKEQNKAITALFCPICVFELSKSKRIKKKSNRMIASEPKKIKNP